MIYYIIYIYYYYLVLLSIIYLYIIYNIYILIYIRCYRLSAIQYIKPAIPKNKQANLSPSKYKQTNTKTIGPTYTYLLAIASIISSIRCCLLMVLLQMLTLEIDGLNTSYLQ